MAVCCEKYRRITKIRCDRLKRILVIFIHLTQMVPKQKDHTSSRLFMMLSIS